MCLNSTAGKSRTTKKKHSHIFSKQFDSFYTYETHVSNPHFIQNLKKERKSEKM